MLSRSLGLHGNLDPEARIPDRKAYETSLNRTAEVCAHQDPTGYVCVYIYIEREREIV